jgi:uncharacterized protein
MTDAPPTAGPDDRTGAGTDRTTVTEVTFDVDGEPCVGSLFRPRDATGDLPCVVMGHGFTGTADRLLPLARAFADAGLAALAFDYRNFGRSGGRQRQTISLSGQRADFHAAVAHARRTPGIDPDRIAIWGSSLGGGHVVVVAAEDPRLAAVVAQVPFNGFPSRVEGRSTGDTLRLLRAMLRDQVRSFLGRPPYYIPAVGNTGDLAVMAGPEVEQTVAAMSGRDSLWRNRVAPGVLLDMMRYRPGDRADEVSAPLLLCLAEFDREMVEEHTMRIAERAPRAEVRRYPVSHFEIYRPEVRARVLADQIAFLRTHLGHAGSAG